MRTGSVTQGGRSGGLSTPACNKVHLIIGFNTIIPVAWHKVYSIDLDIHGIIQVTINVEVGQCLAPPCEALHVARHRMMKAGLLERLNQPTLAKTPVVCERCNSVLLPIRTFLAEYISCSSLPQDSTQCSCQPPS
jgi:hypothetical protein